MSDDNGQQAEDDDADERTTDGPAFDGGIGPMHAHWDDVVEEAEATAAEYEERGWETLVLRPGDVTPLVGEDAPRQGFDVLLPDDEFADLLDVMEDAAFDGTDVYASVADGLRFQLVVLEDESSATAILFPTYYYENDDDLDDLRDHAADTGRVKTHLRNLKKDRIVSFEYEDPSIFFPDEE